MSIDILQSKVWWEPLTRTVEEDESFKRFYIECFTFDLLKKHLHDELAKNKGMFFFAMEDDSRVPVAATAISFRSNTLAIHFYWYGCEHSAAVRIALFREVNNYCIANSNQVSLVQYPVPLIQFDKRLVRYFVNVPDEYERLILWHKIPYNEFMLGIGVFSR